MTTATVAVACVCTYALCVCRNAPCISTQHYWICTVHVLSACQSYSLYFHYDMKIWKVLNSEIHVISSCILYLFRINPYRQDMCVSECNECTNVRMKQGSTTLVWLGIHELTHFHLCGLSRSIRYAYVCACAVCVCLWCGFSSLILLLNWVHRTHSKYRAHFNWNAFEW